MITLIACVSKNLAIGKGNDLLFSFREDMEFFKTHTLHKPVIMGARTARSLPNSAPLKNRDNFVLCSEKDKSFFSDKGFTTVCGVSSIQEAITKVYSDNNFQELLVIGGGMIYKESISIADRLLITVVDEVVENADTFFPIIDSEKWVLNWSTSGKTEKLTFSDYLKK
ncbi:dihydrofolate reductase [Vibrio parahaemolyticus]|uniref:dihydrofolate reductase n=1 Tax=Vibrio parahaemolyticus TaxID=670 RepID=UPI0005C72392